MKRFFLIPLLTLLTCVMAWGGTITIGTGGDYASFAAANSAIQDGDLVQLVSDITLTNEYNLTKSVTVDFNGFTMTSTGNYLFCIGGTGITKTHDNTVTFTDNSVAGNGGITAPKGCIDVFSHVIINGGTFTSTATTGGAIWVETEASTLTFNNGVVNGRNVGIGAEGGGHIIINNGSITGDLAQAVGMRFSSNGYLEIHGGSMISNSSTSHNNSGTWCYAVISHGTFLMTGGKISGVHGGLAISQSGATARIEGGEFETRHGVDGQNNNHYALHVAVGAVVNVFGGKFKVETPSSGADRVALVSNNDNTNSYGIINLYGGIFQDKVMVSSKKNAESSYPTSIPKTSQWYSSFGEEAPLPAGYAYEAITSGEDYDNGYRYKVVRTNPNTDAIEVPADPSYTIPWQQSTTWSSEQVPEDNTIVTIPANATVVVKGDIDDNAVAEQVFVNQGAKLTVESGKTLNIGEGGINIAYGGQVVVEPNAVVTIGDAGIVTAEEKAIIIEASEQEQGVLLLNPAVTENTRPKATVKLVTKAKQIAENDFIYERFAIPTIDGSQTRYSNEGLDTVHYYNTGTELLEGLYEWSDAANDWVGVSSWKNLQPFTGYQLTNNSQYGNVVYTFEGNLVGNHDENYTFSKAGFGFFGNSYTGAIDIKNFLEDFGGDMQKSIWIYDYITDGFKIVTEDNYGTVKYGSRRNPQGLITEIRSMQAFIMYRGAIGSQAVDYSNAIWGNPKYGLVEEPAGAPAKRVAEDADHMTVYVFSGNKEDEVTLIRSNEYSNEFDNGADASKWMNKSMNLYIAGEENLAILASDNIDNTTIAFQSGKETEYTIGFADLRGEEYILRDVLTGAMIQMVEGAEYTFTQEANTTVPARFQVIAPARIPTGVENVENAPVMQKVMLNGTLYILRDNKWYSVQGQNVK